MCGGFETHFTPRPDQVGVGLDSIMDDNTTDTLHAMMEGTYADITGVSEAEAEIIGSSLAI